MTKKGFKQAKWGNDADVNHANHDKKWRAKVMKKKAEVMKAVPKKKAACR